YPHKGVLAAGEPFLPGGQVEVAEQADELGQRDRVDRLAFERDRARGSPTPGLDLREGVKAVDVAREAGERSAILQRGGREEPARPVKLAELNVRPRERLPLADRSAEGEPHRGNCTVPVA